MSPSMPQRPFFLSNPPFSFLAQHLAKDGDFVSELTAILDLDEECYQELVRALEEFDGFLDRPTLAGIVARTVAPEGESDKVTHLLGRLTGLVRESEEGVQSALTSLKAAIREHAEDLEENQRGTVGDRLEALLSKPPGFARQHKARQLVEATGTELTDLQIICDVRPVFNGERTEIEGALPVSTLRLDLTESDGRTSKVEVRLSERQIADLCTCAETARRKVTLIKKTLDERGFALPETPATLNQGEAG